MVERHAEERLPDDIIDDLQAIAARVPALATGSRTLEVRFLDGKYRKAYLHLGPMNRDELVELAREGTRR